MSQEEEKEQEYIHYKPSVYDKMVAQDRTWQIEKARRKVEDDIVREEYKKIHGWYPYENENYKAIDEECDKQFYDKMAKEKLKRKKDMSKEDAKEIDDKVRHFIVGGNKEEDVVIIDAEDAPALISAVRKKNKKKKIRKKKK